MSSQSPPNAGFTASEFKAYETRLASPTTSTSTLSVPDYDLSFKNASVLEVALPPAAYIPNADGIIVDKEAIAVEKQPGRKQYPPWLTRWRFHLLNVYRRLFSIVFLANVAGLLALLLTCRDYKELQLVHMATAAAANLLVAVLIRVDYIVNSLFELCWLVPVAAPLKLRRFVAKSHEHGGIHSGTAVAATMWFVLFSGFLAYRLSIGDKSLIPELVLTYVILVLLVIILVFAYPRLRVRSHNSFELTHRLVGWTVVGLFWAELGLLVHSLSISTKENPGLVLVKLPSFWFLLVATFHIILPWLRLKKVEVIPEVLSDHAVRMHFKAELKPFRALALSTSPLLQWHTFATFPSADSKSGGTSMIISNAGDWTRDTIQNPRTAYWVRGLPRTGVLSMAQIFRSCIIVTTGSGIGPCLSFLARRSRCSTQQQQQPVRLLWSTPDPLNTFGRDVVDLVRALEPGALIVDTKRTGRPDMVNLVHHLYLQERAEAVFVISNPPLTRKIVHAMESKGIPAFGPIWDS